MAVPSSIGIGFRGLGFGILAFGLRLCRDSIQHVDLPGHLPVSSGNDNRSQLLVK